MYDLWGRAYLTFMPFTFYWWLRSKCWVAWGCALDTNIIALLDSSVSFSKGYVYPLILIIRWNIGERKWNICTEWKCYSIITKKKRFNKAKKCVDYCTRWKEEKCHKFFGLFVWQWQVDETHTEDCGWLFEYFRHSCAIVLSDLEWANKCQKHLSKLVKIFFSAGEVSTIFNFFGKILKVLSMWNFLRFAIAQARSCEELLKI